jgi:hypothetical protein
LEAPDQLLTKKEVRRRIEPCSGGMDRDRAHVEGPGDPLDREVGDMIGSTGPFSDKAFRFVRYNAAERWLGGQYAPSTMLASVSYLTLHPQPIK